MTKEMFFLHLFSAAGYLFHGAACLPASLFIRQEYAIKTKKKLPPCRFQMPSLFRLERLSYQLVVIGFVLLTLGFPVSEVVALYSTDAPPESTLVLYSALLVWCLYALSICMHCIRHLRGGKAVRIINVSFMALSISYVCGHILFKLL